MEPLPTDPAYAFWNTQLERLGTRDPLDVLASTGNDLASLLATYGPEAFRAAIEPGAWRPVEVLGHLLDIEWVMGFRMRTILADDHPVLAPMDQDRWVLAQTYAERDAHEVWELFRAARTVNVEFWRRVPEAAMQRAGRHAEAELDLTLELLQRIQAGHDLVHLDRLQQQLERHRTA